KRDECARECRERMQFMVISGNDDDRWQVVMIQLVGFLVVSIQLGFKNSSIQIVSRNIKILPETRQCSKIFSLVASFFAAVGASNVSRMETTGCDGQVGLVRGCLDEIHKGWHDAFDIHNFAM
ncbi:hypothetical protein HID58_075705, partial [Brassica napus]